MLTVSVFVLNSGDRPGAECDAVSVLHEPSLAVADSDHVLQGCTLATIDADEVTVEVAVNITGSLLSVGVWWFIKCTVDVGVAVKPRVPTLCCGVAENKFKP